MKFYWIIKIFVSRITYIVLFWFQYLKPISIPFQIHHKPTKKSVLTKLQSEIKALKETFLRALDIAEHMGSAMDTLNILDDNQWNDTNIGNITTRRTRRNAVYTKISSKETDLTSRLAEKMRALPLEKVRKIWSGKSSIRNRLF